MGTGAFWVGLLLLLSALRPGRGAPLESDQEESPPVVSLSVHNFATTLQDNHAVLVAFCAPFCHHCKHLKSEFEKATEVLNGRVLLATTDAHSEVAISEMFGISAYPTVYFFRGGQQYQYGGGHHNSSIVTWLLQHSGLSLIVTSQENLDMALVTRGTPPIFVARGQKSLQEIFRALALEYNEMGTFYFVENKEDTMVQIHRGIDELITVRVEETNDPAAILRILRTEQIPQWGEVSQRNYASYLKGGFERLLWVCFEPSTVQADAKRLSHVFKEISDTFKTARAVYLDTGDLGEFARDNLGCTDYPTLSLQVVNSTSGKGKTWTLPIEISDITVSVISQWMGRVLEGLADEEAFVKGFGRECSVEVHNVGQTLTSEECAQLVLGQEDQGCGDTFMFSHAYTPGDHDWGCWCCAPGDVGKPSRLWNLYSTSGPA